MPHLKDKIVGPNNSLILILSPYKISFFFRDYSRIIIHGDRRCVANQSSNPKTELTCVNRSPPPNTTKKKTKQKTDLRTIKGSYFSGSVT